MDDRTFVIIGSNGQLGRALQQKYPNAVGVDSDKLDITNAEAVNNFDWSNVKVIFNAAAYTNVDGAESDGGKTTAWDVNRNGVKNLAEIATAHDITLVHISTEYVFDGTKSPHNEDEPISPLSEYGKSKAAGDEQAGRVPKHYIIRTSWVIGDGKNFVRTMLAVGKKGISPVVVADQIGRLTFTSELVRAIDHLLSREVPYGTYNVSNGGELASWADITRAIFKDAGFDDLKVTDTTTGEYFADKPQAAKRPLESTLALDKIEATGFKPRDWQEDLRKYVEKELA